jgi:hypothetical protein
MQFIYPLASMKGVQDTEEAFSKINANSSGSGSGSTTLVEAATFHDILES